MEAQNTSLHHQQSVADPCFCKIIVSPLAQKYKIRIPEEFVKKYGEELSDDKIYLKVPNCEEAWKVKLVKENKEIYLGKGWQVMMEFYNLEFGHVLVFRLDNGCSSLLQSHFHVNIFDKSGTEIDYPLVRSSRRRVFKRSTDRKVGDDRFDDELDENLSFKFEEELVAADEKTRVTKCLEAFRSEKPYFKKIMIPSFVSKPYQMSIPIRHVRRNLKAEEVQEIQLKVANQVKRYRVRLKWYQQSSQAALGFGWKKFVVENDLQPGDGCVFELVNPRDNAYKVTIFRVATASSN